MNVMNKIIEMGWGFWMNKKTHRVFLDLYLKKCRNIFVWKKYRIIVIFDNDIFIDKNNFDFLLLDFLLLEVFCYNNTKKNNP